MIIMMKHIGIIAITSIIPPIQDEGSEAYSAKSVILDIADNYGDSSYMGIRAIDFWMNSSKINIIGTDFNAYSTTNLSAYYIPELIFNTTLLKTGSALNSSWLSSGQATTNQRIAITFNTAIEFDAIKINNAHHIGGNTSRGLKNVNIYISDDVITSTVYNAPISNSVKIFDGVFAEHITEDVEDPQILELV